MGLKVEEWEGGGQSCLRAQLGGGGNGAPCANKPPPTRRQDPKHESHESPRI